MKRTGMLLILMLLPLPLTSMNPVSDYDLSKVTGQAGVTLEIDAVMDVAFSEVGWGDTDGIPATPTDGGWIGISDLKMNRLHVWPRTDYAMESPDFGGSAEADGDGGLPDVQFATVDLVTLIDDTGTPIPVMRAGIPTLSITLDSMFVNIVLGPFESYTTADGNQTLYRPHFNQMMGRLYVGGLNMATGKDGATLIYPHGAGGYISPYAPDNTRGILYGSGLDIVVENTRVDYLLLDSAAWGDTDGVEDIVTADIEVLKKTEARDTRGLNGEGWVGLKDLAIKNLNVNGMVMIDMATIAASDNTKIHDIHTNPAAFLGLPEAMDDIYNAAFVSNGGKTLTNIILGDGFTITMEEMGAQIALGRTVEGVPDLSKVMGDIYAGGMTIDILDNQRSQTRSYVRLFAH